ncbi:MAG: mannose-1-phosphate guanylyltransferase [Lachnospiraceae bacterium]|nr:mannose-1-phosphate guanylyltransferase [Lachnospiraceae bacterium]
MKIYGLIMAGGGGTRFWPLSRKRVPKQLLNLDGKEVMLNETIDRLEGVVEKNDIFIVTNQEQVELTKLVTAERVLENHILSEPSARNTAACIGYGAIEILKKYGDGIMCILASDHYIKNEEKFREVLKKAIETVEETDGLVTIGIKPTFPSTGYGYIRNEEMSGKVYKKVLEFVEKPDLERAETYVESGNYVWNSGMFVWKASTILRYFERLLPDIYDKLMIIKETMGTASEYEVVNAIYDTIPKISIDYGIMERADSVYMLEGDFGWNDIGSFDALSALYQSDERGNIVRGENVLIDSKDNVIIGENKLIACVGVENLIVVETGDALLVCKKDRAQDVKEVVSVLEKTERKHLL